MPKKPSRLEFQPEQIVLPGLRLFDALEGDYSVVCGCPRGMATSGFVFCEDAPWECPRSVPPTCNTGVHGPRRAAASSFWKRREIDPRCDEE